MALRERPLEQLLDHIQSAQQQGAQIHLTQRDKERLRQFKEAVQRNPRAAREKLLSGGFD